MLLRDSGVKLKSCLCESAASSGPNQNYVLSQKRLVIRSAGACPPRASEPCEGQALALRDPATVQCQKRLGHRRAGPVSRVHRSLARDRPSHYGTLQRFSAKNG